MVSALASVFNDYLHLLAVSYSFVFYQSICCTLEDVSFLIIAEQHA